MKTIEAKPDDRIIDSLPFSSMRGLPSLTRAAQALRASGVDGVALYLGVATADHVTACHAAGLYVLGVTLAGRYDGALAASEAKALGLTMGSNGTGTTVFLDVEGKTAFNTEATAMIAQIKAWALHVEGAGFMPGLYLGEPQPLTSSEIFDLPVRRYWHGQGSMRDRNGALVEPKCGWCMRQAYPSYVRGGILVDGNQVQKDFFGRLPMVCAA